MSRGGFGKVYRSLWDGTLGPDWPTWSVWVFALAHADSAGIIDMTPTAISVRSGIPLEQVKRALHRLEQPDPDSRSQLDQGRRLVRLDEHRSWGWRIPTYLNYRTATAAERALDFRRRHAPSRAVTPASRDVTKPNQAEAEAEAEAEETESKNALATLVGDKSPVRRARKRTKATEPEYAAGFLRCWAAYASPRRVRKRAAFAEWERQGLEARADETLAKLDAFKLTDAWAHGFEPEIMRWLRDHLEDEPVTTEQDDGW